MRTTLTLEERIARDLKQLARRSGKPLKRYRLRPVSLGGVQRGLNLDKALALADALEDDELTQKMELLK